MVQCYLDSITSGSKHYLAHCDLFWIFSALSKHQFLWSFEDILVTNTNVWHIVNLLLTCSRHIYSRDHNASKQSLHIRFLNGNKTKFTYVVNDLHLDICCKRKNCHHAQALKVQFSINLCFKLRYCMSSTSTDPETWKG